VNPFQVQGVPVRTIAHYVDASGDRIISVKGVIERVTFDPGWLEVTGQFARRGLQSLVGGWDSLLLLGCLVVPIRPARAIVGLVAAVTAGQVAGAVIGSAAPSLPGTLAMIQVIAASAIVVASIQNIAGARLQWVRALAIGFGAVYGYSQGNEFSMARPFAGEHAALAAVIFMSVAIVSQAWTTTVLWLIRRWLDERGFPERIATIGLSGLIAHSAIHRVLERGPAIGPEFERLVTQVTMGWAVVILAVAAIEAVRMRTRMAHVPPTRADA
jgi:hypothetical protein